MGGSNSKNSIFDDCPEHYLDVLRYNFHQFHKKNWTLEVYGEATLSHIEVRRRFADYERYAFVYQLIAVNKHSLRKKMIRRGVVQSCYTIYRRRIITIHYAWYEPNYDKLNFQAVVYAVIENNRLRKLNFEDKNVYGKSTTVLAAGERLQVPVQFLNIGAPFLAEYIDEKKPNPKLKCSEDFFQVFHGVHVQLKVEEIKTILKFASKFQVLNVKRYCEHQLIRREDLEVSEKQKFKMACKFNLNILMNQVLRNVKSVEKLAKLASIAIEMESIDTNISKLLIARMYKIS